MQATCILHNYMLGVDPNDQFVQLFSSETKDVPITSQNWIQHVQREENRLFVELRDKIVNEMWPHYISS